MFIGSLPNVHSQYRLHATACAVVSDSVFMGTRHGLFLLLPNRPEPVLLPIPARDSLPPISALAIDPTGDLWIGTDGLGLFQRHGATIVGRSTTRYVRALAGHPDTSIWIGSDIGVLHLKGGTLKHYSEEITAEGVEIKDNIIDLIEIDDEGNIWIGTGQGMNVIPSTVARHASEAHHEVPSFDYVGRRGNDVLCVLAYGTPSRCWLLGTTDGLFVVDGAVLTDEHDHATDDPTHRERTTARRIAFNRDSSALSVTSLLLDDHDGLLVGTSDGLYRVPLRILELMLTDQ